MAEEACYMSDDAFVLAGFFKADYTFDLTQVCTVQV